MIRALGETVKPYGRIVAVGCLKGERYYWLVDQHKTVSMMPAVIVEGVRR